LTIRAAEQCPESLTIKSKAVSGGMIEYDVSLDAEEIADASELYQDRVRSHARLIVGAPQQQIALVTVHGTTEGKRTRYQFRLAPAAARTSELQLAISLHEKTAGPPMVAGSVCRFRSRDLSRPENQPKRIPNRSSSARISILGMP
jgi:hypothetical protein